MPCVNQCYRPRRSANQCQGNDRKLCQDQRERSAGWFVPPRSIGTPPRQRRLSVTALIAVSRGWPFTHLMWRRRVIVRSTQRLNPARFKDDASLEELKANVMKHLTILAPVLDLEAIVEEANG